MPVARPTQGLEPIRRLAEELGGVVDWSELLHRYLLVCDDLTMTLELEPPGCRWNGPSDCPATRGTATWFAEDYCEGPGQALIVNPKGEVKPCCGFASDLDQLTIGNIHTDSVAAIIRRGAETSLRRQSLPRRAVGHPRRILTNDPNAFPAATSNHCFFCWYVLTKNLTALPGTESNGRVGLPMARAAGTEFVMAFDGKTVSAAGAISRDAAGERSSLPG